KGVVDDPTIRNAVYESSYALGDAASLFTSAAVKGVTVPIDLGLKIVEAGLLFNQAREEDQQFAALSNSSSGSSARFKKQQELEAKMGELQDQRSRLELVVQRSQ